MSEEFIWSCEDSEQVEAGEPCRNPYGCHCREITELVRERDRLGEEVSTRNTRAGEGMNIIKVHMALPEKGASKSTHINLDNVCAIQRLSLSTQIVFVGGWTILVDETPEEIGERVDV